MPRLPRSLWLASFLTSFLNIALVVHADDQAARKQERSTLSQPAHVSNSCQPLQAAE